MSSIWANPRPPANHEKITLRNGQTLVGYCAEERFTIHTETSSYTHELSAIQKITFSLDLCSDAISLRNGGDIIGTLDPRHDRFLFVGEHGRQIFARAEIADVMVVFGCGDEEGGDEI